NLFSSTLSRQSLLHALLLARLQVVGVTLHFLNYVFRLNLALEPTQGILLRLTLLQSNFCQTDHPQTSPDRTNFSIHHSEYPSSALSSSSSSSLPSPSSSSSFSSSSGSCRRRASAATNAARAREYMTPPR